MKLIPPISAFVIATMLAFSAPAQDSCNYSSLVVPDNWGNQLRHHAKILENSYSKILNKKVTVVSPTGGYIQRALHQDEFYSNDGSQLAMAIVDPVAAMPDFLQNLNVVALLAREDLALFVRVDRRIRELNDLIGDSSDRIVVGARTAAAEYAALLAFERLDVPIELISPTDYSAAKEQLEYGQLDVLIESLSNYHLSPEPSIVPIAVFPSGDLDSQSNAGAIDFDVQASFDYILVAPPTLDRICSDAINADLNKLYSDTEFIDEVKNLGLVPRARSLKWYENQRIL